MQVNKRIYQAYYTKSEPIVAYMLERLNLSGNEYVLEPCSGDGVFIDALLERFPNIRIDAIELESSAIETLNAKYWNRDNISIRQADTLVDEQLQFRSAMGNGYDAVIANPPYGGWRTQKARARLKKSYEGLYAKESYALFLYRCIKSLKPGGKLAFIIPDTYLNLRMHAGLRKYLLENADIQEISLFPSSFFPGVNFGYANLSILHLIRKPSTMQPDHGPITIKKGFSRPEDLLDTHAPQRITLELQHILSQPDYAFHIPNNTLAANCIQRSDVSIGDFCKCVTGFYSGNDKSFLKARDLSQRNAKKYDLVDIERVKFACNQSHLNGLEPPYEYAPIMKGGNQQYVKPDIWFMRWTPEQVNYYKTNSKARFQNSSYYFRQGIGVPMVSSTAITAALIDKRLFDQSIVGVFPKDEALTWLLLAFFNSPTCNQLIRTINSSTNNSANYIKKIPFNFPPDAVRAEIEWNTKTIVAQLKAGNNLNEAIEARNNKLFREVFGF